MQKVPTKEQLLAWLINLGLSPIDHTAAIEMGVQSLRDKIQAQLRRATEALTGKCYGISWERAKWHEHEKLQNIAGIEFIQAWAGLRPLRSAKPNVMPLDLQREFIELAADQLLQYRDSVNMFQQAGLRLPTSTLLKVVHAASLGLAALLNLQTDLDPLARPIRLYKKRLRKVAPLLKAAQGDKQRKNRLWRLVAKFVTPLSSIGKAGWVNTLKASAMTLKGCNVEPIRDAMVELVVMAMGGDDSSSTYVRAHAVLSEVLDVRPAQAHEALTIDCDSNEQDVAKRIMDGAVAAASSVEPDYLYEMIAR